MTSSDHIAVRSEGHQVTFDELNTDVFGFRGQVPLGGRTALSTDDAAVVAAALVALDGWAAEVRLIPPTLDVGVDTDLVRLIPSSSGTDDHGRAEQPTRWILFTSGTTGEPKTISHTTASLTRTTVAGAGGDFVWGLFYDPNRMAGLQVLLQGLRSRATIVAPAPDRSLADRARTMIAGGVNAVSATPSLWRQLLQLPEAASWALRQITLGGEIADQRILDALSGRYPSTRIVHVFASTETGAAFSVKDGREGFPVAYLSDPPRGVALDVRDDILHVHSPGVSAAAPDGFASTGDIVEIVEDRVLFRGRASGVVNVGGANVWPETVEAVLRRHPDVIEAVVSSKPNSMMGNVLVAQVTVTADADRESAAKTLRRWVREQAPRSHVPASVDIVDELDIAATGKVIR